MTTNALTFQLEVAVSETLFLGSTPDDRVVVKVDANVDAAGTSYDCTVTLDGKTVLEQLKTDDQNKMLIWAKRQMVEAMRRCSRS